VTIRELARADAPWLDASGPLPDRVLSSRVRLARNLEARPFPHRASTSESEEVLALVREVAGPDSRFEAGSFWNLEELSRWEREVLMERHLASPRLVAGNGPRAVLGARDGLGGIAVNEEDHLRIQCVSSGFQPREALAAAVAVDRELESRLPFAASSRWGYLTACPTNVGTGLRASVLLHLPGLALSGEIKRVHAAVAEMGMVVRGWFGEGTRALGDSYQVSNQRTLGPTEEEAVDGLVRVAERVIQLEGEARERAGESPERRRRLEDRVHRSRAILGAARMLTVEQAMACVSDVRLGKWMGFFDEVAHEALNRFTLLAQPAHLGREESRLPEPEEAQWERARLARESFGSS